MPNKIQIKRTTVTGRTPNTTNASNTRYIDTGELSLNLTDAKLFSSDGTNYFEVGSNLNSIAVGGTFTANATLVNAAALNVVNQTNTGTLFVTTSANVGTLFSINSSALVVNSTGAVGTLIKVSHTSTGNILVIEDESSETSPLVIDATGYVVLGSNSAPAVGTVGTSRLTAAGAAADLASIGIFRNDETAGPAALTFGKTRVTTSNLAINDVVGRIEAAGNDGTDNRTPLSRIEFVVDGATSLDDMPGRIVLSTTADGASAVTERMRLDSTGLTTVNTNLYVVSSANVASAFLANSTGAYHTGTMNAASHTVGTTTIVNSTAIALGPFGTTNGVLITTTSLDIGNTTANAALDYNIIYVANSTARANLTPTTLAIGSITVNSALANLQALNVVNQTNTATIFVTTSANVASAFLANSTGAYHTGTMNAVSHTVGTNFTSNSSQMVLNAPSYTVSFSNTNGSATNYITWSTSLQQAVPSTTTRSLGTKIIFYEGLSGSATDWAYGLAGSEMWASVGTTTGTFRWYAVTTAFMTSNTTFLNHNAQVRVGGGVGTTNGTTITNTSIAVGNSTINTSANSTAILVNGTDLVATQKRSIAMSLVFGR